MTRFRYLSANESLLPFGKMARNPAGDISDAVFYSLGWKGGLSEPVPGLRQRSIMGNNRVRSMWAVIGMSKGITKVIFFLHVGFQLRHLRYQSHFLRISSLNKLNHIKLGLACFTVRKEIH